MSQHYIVKVATRLAVLLFFLTNVWTAPVTRAQEGDNLAELKLKAAELTKQTKYTEALPLLEKIVVADPANAEMHFQLAFALIAQANTTQDEPTQRQLRIRARNEFIKAKELGAPDPLVEALIHALPADGKVSSDFSKNIRANALMVEAEGFFAQGKLDEALKNYQQAIDLDPGLYYAALFSGDVYQDKGDFPQAETWYQKAIAIDPNRETAYRYSATPLMKQGKIQEARDRYIEAFITEPYNKFARAGIVQWGQATKTVLAHPNIQIPTDVSFDEKGDAKINLDPSALLNGADDGSIAWVAYGTTRSAWHKEKFALTFPAEKNYRHSLAEEAGARRSRSPAGSTGPKAKTLSPAPAMLKKLNDSGLLEAYILLARADEGILQDHPAYLKQNRDKLRRYVLEYVVTGGGQGGNPPKAAARICTTRSLNSL